MKIVRSHNLLANALCITVLCVYLAMGLEFPMAYIWATYEDLMGEWIQFWAFFLTLCLSLRLVFLRIRYRIFFGVLALGCFYVAMEEISWGQRVFGFSSPAFFKAHNLQGETNLHNFLTGPYTTELKAVITNVLAAALAVFGTLYPLAVRRGWRLAVWLERRGLPSPPLYLSAFFISGAVLEIGPIGFNEAEVAEILVGLALVIMTVHYLFTQRNHVDPHNVQGWPRAAAGQLAARIGTASFTVLLLAGATTAVVYASPEHRERILKRIDNGVEKFAGRYARVRRWRVASRLYERVLERKPSSASTRRNLADCYARTGDLERRDAYLQEALAIDLKRYRDHPDSASINRSLTRTYRKMGEFDKAEKHLKDALRIGLARVKKHPNSLNAAYSLGRTYSLMERHSAALEQYSRAYKHNPTSKKFRKAYYRARNKVR